MSHHIDEQEFQEAVRAKNWGFIWAAYQYAVNGGETTTVERLIRERDDLLCEIGKLKEFQIAKEKTIEALKTELEKLWPKKK